MNTNAIRNEGDWPPIRDWLDHLGQRGMFRVPVGPEPAITRRYDGVLEIRDVHNGAILDQCPVGWWVILSEGQFTVATFPRDEPEP